MTEHEHAQDLPAVDARLYRENIFRVTGLPVDAAGGLVRRRREEARRAAGVGVALPGGQTTPFPLDPPPDPNALLAALEQFRDPVRRLRDELFWIWRPDSAGESGTGGGDGDGPGGLEREHDFAVIAHCRALDLEHASRSRNLSPEERTERDAQWKAALSRWAAVVERRDLWERMRRRAGDLDDPRLSNGTVRRLRERLPEAILSVSAQVAVDAVRRGHTNEAAQHATWMRQSAFKDADVEEALRAATAPTVDELRAACSSALDAATADRNAADAIGQRLLDQARPLVTILVTVLWATHPVTLAAKDGVADAVDACANMSYGAKEDLAAAVRLLEQALPYATETVTREQVKRDLDNARELAVLRTRTTQPWTPARQVSSPPRSRPKLRLAYALMACGLVVGLHSLALGAAMFVAGLALLAKQGGDD